MWNSPILRPFDHSVSQEHGPLHVRVSGKGQDAFPSIPYGVEGERNGSRGVRGGYRGEACYDPS
jgi:hypothetical protein